MSPCGMPSATASAGMAEFINQLGWLPTARCSHGVADPPREAVKSPTTSRSRPTSAEKRLGEAGPVSPYHLEEMVSERTRQLAQARQRAEVPTTPERLPCQHEPRIHTP